MWTKTIQQVRLVVIFVIGMTLLACGVVMLVTPGPGLLVIVAGLSVLAVEFAWARQLLRKTRAKGNAIRKTIFGNGSK